MADFRINVIVDPSRSRRGINNVERGLNRAGNAADRLRSRLQQAFAGIGVGLAVRQIIKMADAVTNLNNRMRLVTSSERELVAVNRQLFAIANRTRSSFEGTGELFARLAIASKELGVNNQELLQFTESLNQAIILSGASAVEAQAGLIQLSQGMASGTLRGDELRSVLEQLPAVADVIAKQLKVTRGELRQMGADGKITANTILDAFKAAREELAEKFATTVPTVGQALTVLRNKFLQLITDFDKANGITRTLAKGVLLLANNIDTLIPIAAALATIIGIQLARVAIPALTGAILALWAAFTAHPIGVLITALAALVVWLITTDNKVGGLSTTFGETGRAISAFGTLAAEAIQTVIGWIVGLVDAIVGLLPEVLRLETTWSDVGDAITVTLRGIVDGVDFMRAAFISAYSGVVDAWEGLPAAFERIALQALNGAISLVEAGVNKIKQLIAELPFMDEFSPTNFGRLRSLFGEASPAGGSAAASGLQQSGRPGFEDVRGELTAKFDQLTAPRGAESPAGGARAASEMQGYADALDQANNSTNTLNSSSKGLGVTFDSIIKKLDQETMLLGLSNSERQIQEGIIQIETQLKRDLTEAERALVDQKLRYNQELAVERQLLNEINGPMEKYKEQVAALERLLAKGAISTAQFNAKMNELSTSIQGQAPFMQKALESVFSSAADALAEFVRTGEFDFKKFVNSILSDITRLAANQLFKSLLGGGGGLFGGGGGGGLFGGGGGGGLLSGLGSLFGFADGGSFDIGGRPGTDRNVLSLNGRPVARVSRGESVDVSPQGGGRTTVVMNINTPDADSFRRSQDQIMSRTQFALERARRRNG